MMRIVPGSVVGIASDQKRGMTLGELAEFVNAAYGQGAPTDAIVECTATWRNSIKRLKVPQGTERSMANEREE